MNTRTRSALLTLPLIAIVGLGSVACTAETPDDKAPVTASSSSSYVQQERSAADAKDSAIAFLDEAQKPHEDSSDISFAEDVNTVIAVTQEKLPTLVEMVSVKGMDKYEKALTYLTLGNANLLRSSQEPQKFGFTDDVITLKGDTAVLAEGAYQTQSVMGNQPSPPLHLVYEDGRWKVDGQQILKSTLVDGSNAEDTLNASLQNRVITRAPIVEQPVTEQ